MALPLNITIIYFNDSSKNIYAKLPIDQEQVKRMSKRIFKDAMTAISAERDKQNYLIAACFPYSVYFDSGNST